jgi:hypothetical protein
VRIGRRLNLEITTTSSPYIANRLEFIRQFTHYSTAEQGPKGEGVRASASFDLKETAHLPLKSSLENSKTLTETCRKLRRGELIKPRKYCDAI